MQITLTPGNRESESLVTVEIDNRAGGFWVCPWGVVNCNICKRLGVLKAIGLDLPEVQNLLNRQSGKVVIELEFDNAEAEAALVDLFQKAAQIGDHKAALEGKLKTCIEQEQVVIREEKERNA